MRKGLFVAFALVAIGCSSLATQKAVSGEPTGPAIGYDIHVQAPHMMADGTAGGPFHHYCKGISDKMLQCLLFESTKESLLDSQSRWGADGRATTRGYD